MRGNPEQLELPGMPSPMYATPPSARADRVAALICREMATYFTMFPGDDAQTHNWKRFTQHAHVCAVCRLALRYTLAGGRS